MNYLKNRKSGKLNSNYEFAIQNGTKTEEILVDLADLSPRDYRATWLWIGDINATDDEIILTLSNKTDLYSVRADAVKAVKID